MSETTRVNQKIQFRLSPVFSIQWQKNRQKEKQCQCRINVVTATQQCSPRNCTHVQPLALFWKSKHRSLRRLWSTAKAFLADVFIFHRTFSVQCTISSLVRLERQGFFLDPHGALALAHEPCDLRVPPQRPPRPAGGGVGHFWICLIFWSLAANYCSMALCLGCQYGHHMSR